MKMVRDWWGGGKDPWNPRSRGCFFRGPPEPALSQHLVLQYFLRGGTNYCWVIYLDMQKLAFDSPRLNAFLICSTFCVGTCVSYAYSLSFVYVYSLQVRPRHVLTSPTLVSLFPFHPGTKRRQHGHLRGARNARRYNNLGTPLSKLTTKVMIATMNVEESSSPMVTLFLWSSI